MSSVASHDWLEFLSDLSRLTTLECVRTGISVGSLTTVDFVRIMRPATLDPRATGAWRRGTAPFFLYLSCPWEIWQGKELLCSWQDERARMEAGLGRLLARRAQATSWTGANFGITIDFGEQLLLQLLPERREYLEEYEFCTPQWCYSVFADGHVVKESREPLVELSEADNKSGGGGPL